MKLTEIDDAQVSKTALRAVRYNFNPSKATIVDRIKLLGAVLIEECEGLRDWKPTDPESSELERERKRAASVAITQVEDGVMWAVKAATAGLP